MAKEKPVKEVIHAKDTEITVLSYVNADDYISLTDIARYKNPEFPADIVKNWMRMRNTIEFLGLWEELNNPEFKLVEFDQFKNDAGSNAFVLSPQKWIKSTNAIGMVSKSGRYGGGTFAHKDIAFEFASWISPEFKLYIIKDYQRLKEEHRFVYADEADVLNVALFGMTAKQWRAANPGVKGNIRDFATIEQLLVLVNLESMNALLLQQGKSQEERAQFLNQQAIKLMTKLSQDKGARDLHQLDHKPNLPGK